MIGKVLSGQLFYKQTGLVCGLEQNCYVVPTYPRLAYKLSIIHKLGDYLRPRSIVTDPIIDLNA